MTVNKEKWQEIAEKYDSKAKWADALLLLNFEDHEDLISALIELDPQDLVGPNSKGSQPIITDGWVTNLATEKIEPRYDYAPRLEKLEELMNESEARLNDVDNKITAALHQLDKALASHEGVTVNLSEFPIDPKEIVKAINRELGRDIRSL